MVFVVKIKRRGRKNRERKMGKMKRKKNLIAVVLCIAMVLTLFGSVALAEDSDTAMEPACTEGCTLEAEHEGDCVVRPEQDDEIVKEQEPEQTKQPEESAGQKEKRQNVLSVPAAPAQAPAANGGAVTTSEALEEALEAADGGEIVLGGPVTLENAVTVTGDVTLDLAGNAISTAKKITVTGSLTIQDSASGGTISGTSGQMFWVKNGGAVTLESGGVSTTGYGAVRTDSGAVFRMSGGTLSGAPAVQALNGTVEITGGRLESSKASYAAVENSSAAITIDGAGVYLAGINPNGKAVTFQSGVIGTVKGTFGAGSVLNGSFGSDVSASLPGGKVCVPVEGTGYWQVTDISQETAAADVDGTLYATLPEAAAAVQNGGTLTLLRNYTGDKDITVGAYRATIELNGYSITNTEEGGKGISVYPKYGTAMPANGSLVTIVNSGGKASAIAADVPVEAKSGSSSKLLMIAFEGDISVEAPAGKPGVVLGTSSCAEYTAATAGYVANGGFKAEHADGKEYIHGTFASAAENDVNNTAVLLNNYVTGNDMIAVGSPCEWTLDLGGHMIDISNYSRAISIASDDVTLTVKNGKIIGEQDGAWVGIGSVETGQYKNIVLNMENVDLTASGDYGIVCNGTSTNIDINLKGGSVTAENGIGIYFPPADSTLTIDGTAVSGQTGVAVKGGTVTVKGDAAVTGSGAANTPSEGGTSGVSNTGDAFYVEGNYGRDIKVDIQNGTFESVNGKAVQMLFEDSASGTKEIGVTSGEFSSEVPKEYIVSGMTAASVASGSDTAYFVGTGEAVAETVASRAAQGDTVTVQQGDAALALPEGVTVKNEGEGTVTSNGTEIGTGETVTTKEPVAQVGETKYESLQAAIDAANGGTVTLLADVDECVVIAEGKTVTLDLGTFILSNGDTAAPGIYNNYKDTISNKGTLTIKGSGKIESAVGAIVNYPGATAVLTGGTYASSGWYSIKNMGKMTISEGVSVETTAPSASLVANGWYGDNNTDRNTAYGASTATLTITGGTLTGGMNTVKNDDYGILNITGGTFENTTGPTILNWNETTISGGNFSVPNGFVLANGSFANEADKGSMTITGGTFTSGNGGTDKLLGWGLGGKEGGKLTIQGGTFAGVFPDPDDPAEKAPYEIGVEKGEFNSEVPAEYIEEGKASASLETEGETAYFIGTNEEVAEAIEARAKEGDTVTVQQGDVELALPVGVTVENKGEGEIVVNGEAVEPGETVVTEEEPQPEVKDVYYKDAATGVILNTDTTKVPEGSYLLVKPVAETEQAHADAKEALKDKAGRFVLYDITLVNAAGEPIQPAGDVLIGIPTPDGYDTSKLAVHRINEDKTTVEHGVTVQDGVSYFQTDHFSKYALIEKGSMSGAGTDDTAKDEGADSSDTPKTGDTADMTPYILLVIAAGAAVAAGAVVTVRRKAVKK